MNLATRLTIVNSEHEHISIPLIIFKNYLTIGRLFWLDFL